MVGDARTQLVRAPNPSAMTLEGTNSYLVFDGEGSAICIDPGPAIERHVSALIDAARARNARIEAIAVTHGHPDHWPAAPLLATATGARIHAHPSATFPHDVKMRDGATVPGGTLELLAIDAPGHTFDHLVFADRAGGALFTGDVVLGRGTVVIAPPGGDMRAYQKTLQRLVDEFPDARTIYGGHGPVVEGAQAKLREYIAHRRTREGELLAALAHGPQTIPELVRRIYATVQPILWPAAARQMLAYLIPLEQEGRIRSSILDRPFTDDEQAILNPSWDTIVGMEQAATIEAELGSQLRLDTLRQYELV